MYVRMARFEGGSAEEMERQTDGMRRDIEAVARGESSSMLPREITDVARKVEVLMDRQNVSVAVLIYSDTAADAAEVDRILDSMNPPGQSSRRRVARGIYEVVTDQEMRRRQAA